MPHRFLRVIPRNSERYLSFSLGSLVFKDSFQFLQSSLATLVTNLQTKGFAYFKYLERFIPQPELRKLLLRKGVFPYSYFSDFRVLNLRKLPKKEKFRNDLDGSEISPDDYHHAQTVWTAFHCKNLRDYLEVYLLGDVLQLADVYESFRGNCMRDYRLDPAHYYSSPHFTYDAFLKHSQVTLDLLSDLDQYLFISSSIRGGLSMASKRYSKANNPGLRDYDPSKPTVYILDFDANNLYGKAMQGYLPCGNFRWMGTGELTVEKLMSIPHDSPYGCIVQCTLDYPSELHLDHCDYPLAPVKRCIRYADLSPFARKLCDRHGVKNSLRTEKLLTTFETREDYILHYRNFQLYVSLGMKVRNISRGLFFKQAPFIKSYVDLNSRRRAAATNAFDVDFYKLLSNSLYGKTIENPEKRTKVRLCRTPRELEKCVSKYTFKRSQMINHELVGAEMRYDRVKMNKPFYVGTVVLDSSKLHMYDFHYNVMKEVFRERLQLLYTDTDSLLYEIRSPDPYAELQATGKLKFFDFSNFPKDHPLYSEENKRVPGTFKDECNVRLIREFVGLRSKMYALRFEDDKGEVKIAKGVKKPVIQNDLRFVDYVDCLRQSSTLEHAFRSIRSVRHDVFTFHQRKKTLSSFDDKRYLVDSIHSVSYGCSTINGADGS